VTENVPAVVLMTEAEAEAITVEMKEKALAAETGVAAFEEVLLRAEVGGAWKVRKYKSMAAYVQEESGLGKRRVNQLVAHVKFKAELTAATGGNPVPTLNEKQSRQLTPEAKDEVAQEVAAAGTPEEAQQAVDTAVAKAKEAKRTRNFDPHQLTLNLTGTERIKLTATAVATNTISEAFAGRLFREAVDCAALLVDAGVPDPIETIGRIIRELLETGEKPTIPAANGQRKQRAPRPIAAPAGNGDDHKHVASKPKLSGLVVCEVCNLPRDKWPDRLPAVRAVAKVDRRSVEVEPNFGGKVRK
jgi:hypothetical protein